jgi:hypothetical protein
MAGRGDRSRRGGYSPGAPGRPRGAAGTTSVAIYGPAATRQAGHSRDRRQGAKQPARPTAPSLAVPVPQWPKAGTIRVTTAAAQRAAVARAVPAFVSLRPTPGSALSEVDVTVHDQATAPAGWRAGVLLSVGSPAAAGRATLAVDYKPFAHAYGGDWASRLRLWRLPACGLAATDRSGCRATPLPSVNDPKAGVVTSTVNVPSTRDASGGDVLALAAEPSGEAGDLSATPLANSNGWTAGSNTGGFSWSYPLRTPAAQAGPQPTRRRLLVRECRRPFGRDEQPAILAGRGFHRTSICRLR